MTKVVFDGIIVRAGLDLLFQLGSRLSPFGALKGLPSRLLGRARPSRRHGGGYGLEAVASA